MSATAEPTQDVARSAPPDPAADTRPVVLLDLDGVVWLAHQPIPGSVGAIASLRSGGYRVLFVTNNSASTIEAQEAALAAIGIPAEGDVLTSAVAGALLVEPGERVLVCGGHGVLQALERRGASAVRIDEVLRGEALSGAAGLVRDAGAFDVVMVGLHRDFSYDGLRLATRAVRAGARLIGTNDDATYPTPDGPIPGGGALLAAFATAAGVDPMIAGKPYAPMAALVRELVGDERAREALMVGDRPSTDGGFARTLGCRYALVLSGVTSRDDVVEPAADVIADDLAAVARLLLAGTPVDVASGN